MAYVRIQIDEYSHGHHEEKSGVQQIKDGNESLPRKKSRREQQTRASENDSVGDGVSPRDQDEANGEKHWEPDKSWIREPAEG
jgi:hypothetical protein